MIQNIDTGISSLRWIFQVLQLNSSYSYQNIFLAESCRLPWRGVRKNLKNGMKHADITNRDIPVLPYTGIRLTAPAL